MSDQETIRDNVSRAYARAVNEQRGCCGEEPVQKGVAVKMAGYDSKELADLPPEAVINSFGCGNPVAFLGVREGDVVLDLGSGAGIDLLLAARRVGPTGRAIGVDMTDEMLAKAQRVIADSGFSNVEVRKGLIEELPVEANSVDWVISNCVINLSPDKTRVFSEIARVLKPGGTMVVSDIVAEDLPEPIRNDPSLYCSCVAGAISEQDYCAGLRSAGLVDVEVQDRIKYDASQLKGVIESDLDPVLEESACCGSKEDRKSQLMALAEDCEDKIWSMRVSARKPL